MRAIRVHEHGGPDVLRLDQVELPVPRPDEVVVRVEAAGVNFLDVYQRVGRYPYLSDLPFTLGQEAAGRVEAVGPDVEDLAVGDRVAYAMQQGAYADLAVVPAAKLVRVPDRVRSDVAASAMVQGMTAHYLTTSTVPIEPGMTALVHAAAGGTGRLLVQMAKRRGARVLATASTEEKDRLAREAGADDVIRYRDVDFAEAVDGLTEGVGVDVVYDSVGKDTFDRGLDSLRPRGTMVLYGASSGPVPALDPQILNAKGSLFLTRPTIAHHLATREELIWRAGEVLDMIAAGDLDVRVDRTWPLQEAAEAHRYIEAGKTTGKVLLLP